MSTAAITALLPVLLLLPPRALAQAPQGQNVTTITPPTAPSPECEVVRLPICVDMPYNYTLYPNLRRHTTQDEANNELEQFRRLIEFNCSGAIAHLLCAIYVPFCDPDKPDVSVKPCRRLCQHVRDGCERIFDEKAVNIPWPDHLVCNLYQDDELCFGPKDPSTLKIPAALLKNVVPTNPTDTGTPQTTPTPSVSPPISTLFPQSKQVCPMHMRVSRNLQNKTFSFAGINNCGPNCEGIYFSSSQRNIIAPLFILLFAFVCIVFTLFTVATFLINRNRFHYPERPIVYLSLTYLFISVAYFIGAISKLAGGGDVSFACSVSHSPTLTDYSSRFVFQNLPNDNVNMSTASCVILFLLAYYAQMAAGLWWVILTFTWFLAAVLKWGEEAVARLWLLYHVITWSLPAVQTILVLALQLVDGDQLSGICYPGQFNSVALGVFVFMPLIIYLLVGTVFLVIGFTALVNIRRALERDPGKSRKLGRLIIRIGVYSSLYIIPNAVILFIHIYELAEREGWEEAYVDHQACREGGDLANCPTSPSFSAFIIRYIMIFVVGISSTSWVFSKKTLATWSKFFQSCGCFVFGKDPSTFDPSYGLPEKDPRRLQTAV